MNVNGFVSAGPLVFGGVFGALALISALILVPVIIVVANRAEPDPRGMRPFSVYLFGMSFVTLLLSFAGLTMIVTALLSFIGSHDSPIADGVARSVVVGGLLLLIAGSVWRMHVSKGLAGAAADGRVDGPNARVLHSYIGVVSFFFVVLGMVALGVAIYLIFQLAGPGIFGNVGGNNTGTLRILLDVLYVLITSSAIVVYHVRQSPAGLIRAGSATPTGA